MSDATPLARIEPRQIAHERPGRSRAAALSRRQKAAIVVRFLLNEGAEIPLSDLPEPLQAVLTTQMGSMRYVDRQTLADVVSEFAAELEAMGLTFPRGVAGALTALDGRISPQTAARLRKEAGVRQFGEPWAQVRAAEAEQLLPILQSESAEVAAVLLSKLDVARAAELLGRLPGGTARAIAFEMSRTGTVTPEAVDRIGLALAAQLHDRPETAFSDGPAERIGAILNVSPSATRDDVLTGLAESDSDLAEQVRRAIFTFVHIPDRVNPVDIPRVTRAVDQGVLMTALSYAEANGIEASAAFVLDNMSKRMSETLREDMQEMGRIKVKDGEDAMTAVINAIRTLQMNGEIELRSRDAESD